MGDIRDNVKRNLGYYLSLRDISQKHLAETLGVTQAAVTNWVKGKNSPSIEMVAKICELLDISVTDLFGVEGDGGLSERELRLVRQYRAKPDLQRAVDILLDMGEPEA